jgi:plastocyanin
VTRRQAIISAALMLTTALGAAVACGTRRVPRAHQVEIRNFAFRPETLAVAVGDTVVWTYADFVPHTATARDSAWDSRAVDGGGAWRFVARARGRHAYYCVFHPDMHGVIDVR